MNQKKFDKFRTKSLTLRSLEVFSAVANLGSYGLAAESLMISQPSVSIHIQGLETKLKTQLFTRVPGQKSEITESGKSLLTYTNEILSHSKHLQDSFQSERAQIRIGAQRFVAQSLLGFVFETLANELKGVDVIVRTGTFEEVRNLYKKREVDIAFFLTSGEEAPSWVSEPIFQYRLALIANTNHPLVSIKSVDIRQLEDYPFVTAFKNSYFANCVSHLLNENQIKLNHIVAQAEDALTLKEMVKAGMGLAFTIFHSVKNEIKKGNLFEIDLDLEPMYLQLRYAKNPVVATSKINLLIDKMKLSIEPLKYKGKA
jgi:DNA-binding transcriptional LysR family regulator